MRIATWTPDNGDSLVLSDEPNGSYVLAGDLTGLNMPVYDVQFDPIPGVPGARLRQVRVTERPLSIPMHVHAKDRAEYRQRINRIMRAFAPEGGRMGALELAEGDGTRRKVRAIYTGGLEGEEGGSAGGVTWWTFVIKLVALDPYWYGPEIVSPLNIAAPVKFFPTMAISSAQVAGQLTVFNPGDVAAYPTWTITGPGTDPTLVSPSGQTLALDGDLSAGEKLVIVTKPGAQSLTVDGTPWWDHVTNDMVFWTLPPGDSTFSLEMTGSSEGSSMSVAFEPAFWTPL